MKARNVALALAGITLISYGACRSFCPAKDAALDPKMIFDRVWLERVPESRTDYIHVFYALEDSPRGIFDRGSTYDMHIESFEYRASGGKLELTFPQTNRKATLTYSISKCEDVKPFDLCLDVSENPWGGPKRYRGSVDADRARELLGDEGFKVVAAARGR